MKNFISNIISNVIEGIKLVNISFITNNNNDKKKTIQERVITNNQKKYGPKIISSEVVNISMIGATDGQVINYAMFWKAYLNYLYTLILLAFIYFIGLSKTVILILLLLLLLINLKSLIRFFLKLYNKEKSSIYKKVDVVKGNYCISCIIKIIASSIHCITLVFCYYYFSTNILLCIKYVLLLSAASLILGSIIGFVVYVIFTSKIYKKFDKKNDQKTTMLIFFLSDKSTYKIQLSNIEEHSNYFYLNLQNKGVTVYKNSIIKIEQSNMDIT